MNLAARMGTQQFYTHIRNFGFGQRTGIDFFGESPGIVLREEYVKNIDLARIGFGHAIAMTPLQLVTATAAVVNGGRFMQPHFVTDIVSPCGTSIYSHTPNQVRRVLSQNTSERMRAMLADVVDNGSGSKARVDGFGIGGKTGTAQRYRDGAIDRGNYISSFIGFGPVEDPRYIVLMIVDEPTSYLYYGSILAAPYAGRVLGQIFEYRGLAPTRPPEHREAVIMPDLLGMPLLEAVRTAERLGIRVEMTGESGMVVSTIPAPQTPLQVGDVVLLRS